MKETEKDLEERLELEKECWFNKNWEEVDVCCFIGGSWALGFTIQVYKKLYIVCFNENGKQEKIAIMEENSMREVEGILYMVITQGIEYVWCGNEDPFETLPQYIKKDNINVSTQHTFFDYYNTFI